MASNLSPIPLPDLDSIISSLMGNKAQGQKLRSAEPPISLSPWRSVAIVICTTHITCACGAHYTAPSRPLLRFKHRRKPLTWETVEHVGIQRPELPLIQRHRTESILWCPECLGSVAQVPEQKALDLSSAESDPGSGSGSESGLGLGKYPRYTHFPWVRYIPGRSEVLHAPGRNHNHAR